MYQVETVKVKRQLPDETSVGFEVSAFPTFVAIYWTEFKRGKITRHESHDINTARPLELLTELKAAGLVLLDAITSNC